MSNHGKDQIRQMVRSRYKEIALQGVNQSSCCSSSNGSSIPSDFNKVSSKLGYTNHELSSVPDGANLGLGCGNPQAIADLKPGEVVVDLGSGGGFDCFLAARQVTETGAVIGVDMTPEMISRARSNAENGGFTNTEFRLGEIEYLPVADNAVDVIISNCVINLSPDKPQVFKEAYRVLKSGGRIAISDVVATTEFPLEIKNNLGEFYAGCVLGASSIQDLELMLKQSGFVQISIEPKDESKEFIKDWVTGANIEDYIVSAVMKAVKP
ncbi:methylase involved in ubiquinone/menaquinone biosynthesis [Schinkia azotoformans MEV2011]|uniref:Arsenite methyltransferase n=1 Tax=Schinkia azotoformans MEV2011 TaxID=1348973 RepID=A0A072NKB4_SCHAZ|nr:arsenite methyltransferase [Schinkia azotoformans]KEF37697.1 methylase involved in ubiquinone/menaquinone biosynthesis [Schinkia azotoformans MEV2011]MEC1741960.1 arsenite methyltransferase [Schinkia azotoformans]MEC1766398.1 arsenite methyltransferase [Schinkia azotoformans]MEC1771300.1 arsenite methyltransferase [Schinkia azotoformans]MEC1786422.1 arsenite methyltransferase [Schinkia azotoformans]